MADLIGRQFGNYRLMRLLGEGGFAEVYLGQHVHLSSQQAALKVLSTHLDGQDVEPFVREAETIASLVHPHIVRLLDFDIQDQRPFLVMDYAPYGSLRQRHARGEQVPLPLVVSYVQQISQGLAYAHEKKVIHRDVKPDNMLIDANNQIVISDFGIATIVRNTSSQVSQAISGTIPYMAPEQFQGLLRSASDQYSLAITVYEWLTGVYPFTGTFTEIAIKHATAAPAPLREKCPMLPAQLERVLFTALAKDPKDRFASIIAFANALAQASQLASPMQITPAFPVAYPIQLPIHSLPAADTTRSSAEAVHLRSTEAYQPPVQHISLHLDKRKSRQKGPIVLLILALLALIVIGAFVIDRGSIFAAINALSGHSPTPFVAATSVPTIVVPTATPVPTATSAPTTFSSVADFTTQSPQLSNITLVRNDALFQNDHSILGNNDQVVIAFTAHANMKTVTLVIRALVSQLSPNQSGFSPVNLLCNGQVIVSNYMMPGNGYAPNTTSIQVPAQNLTNGANQIELQVASNAQSNFWLYRLEVQQSA